MKLTSISPINTSKDRAIDLSEVLNTSMPKMKTIPETCPMNQSRLLDMPSGAGAISAPYWNTTGPELSKKNPKTNP